MWPIVLFSLTTKQTCIGVLPMLTKVVLGQALIRWTCIQRIQGLYKSKTLNGSTISSTYKASIFIRRFLKTWLFPELKVFVCRRPIHFAPLWKRSINARNFYLRLVKIGSIWPLKIPYSLERSFISPRSILKQKTRSAWVLMSADSLLLPCLCRGNKQKTSQALTANKPRAPPS